LRRDRSSCRRHLGAEQFQPQHGARGATNEQLLREERVATDMSSKLGLTAAKKLSLLQTAVDGDADDAAT
jgi:hypothetical protein